jgi:hypothetical protein
MQIKSQDGTEFHTVIDLHASTARHRDKEKAKLAAEYIAEVGKIESNENL